MKIPRDVSDGIANRKANELRRETVTAPRLEARRLAKRLFEAFPSAPHQTEIESCRVLRRGFLELTVKRLETPIDDAD